MARTRLSRRQQLRQGPQLSRVRSGFVALADAVSADANDMTPKWVQVTREGNFPGYMGGLRPFAFTRADLDTMVLNIKAHPAYQLDANGNAIGQVIPWDFNHASEQDPTDGSLPSDGAPAQGWTYDLQVRANPATGQAELWALTLFMEPARTYVRLGQYKWASVAVALNAVDPESGQNVGAVVTSIALTNTPFVEGMETLVAAKTPKPGLARQPANTPARQPATVQAYRRDFYQAAQGPEDAICDMRELFGLPETAGAAEVMQQLGIVLGWYQNGGAPLGTDPEYIVGSLRTILNLPTLTADIDVLSEAGKSVQMLVQQQMASAGLAVPAPVAESGTVPPSPTPQVPVSASNRSNQAMADNLLKTLSTMLGIRESDDATVAAVKDLVSLRAGLVEVFKLSDGRDGTVVLLATAKETAAAKDKLLGLFTALGVTDPDKAVAKVAEVMESSAKLKEVMPELEGLRKEKATADEAQAETDVDQAIAARKMPSDVKPALMLFRKTQPAEFAKSYPKAPGALGAVGGQTHLSQTKVTELTSKVALRDGQLQQIAGGAEVIDLAQYPGANPTARAKAYLSSKNVGWSKLNNEQQFQQAVALRKQTNVIDTTGAQA